MAGTARTLALQLGGRPVRQENLHLTLSFIGDVPAARLPAVRDASAFVAGTTRSFSLCFDRIAAWPRQSLCWAGCQETPVALTDLACRLRSTVADGLGMLPASASAPFVPHVTLVRQLRRLPEHWPPLEVSPWPVSHVALVASTLTAEGPIYRTLDHWVLSGAG